MYVNTGHAPCNYYGVAVYFTITVLYCLVSRATPLNREGKSGLVTTRTASCASARKLGATNQIWGLNNVIVFGMHDSKRTIACVANGFGKKLEY